MSLGVSISDCTFDEITRKEGLSLDSYINNAAPDKIFFFISVGLGLKVSKEMSVFA